MANKEELQELLLSLILGDKETCIKSVASWMRRPVFEEVKKVEEKKYNPAGLMNEYARYRLFSLIGALDPSTYTKLKSSNAMRLNEELPRSYLTHLTDGPIPVRTIYLLPIPGSDSENPNDDTSSEYPVVCPVTDLFYRKWIASDPRFDLIESKPKNKTVRGGRNVAVVKMSYKEHDHGEAWKTLFEDLVQGLKQF